MTPLDLFDTGPEAGEHGAVARGWPFVSILFECCHVYARIYRRPDEDRYRGRCPRCLCPVELRVAPDGTPARMFRAR